MVSLRKYLLGSQPDTALDCARIVSLLLEGMAVHTICFDEYEHRAFRDDIRKLHEQLLSQGEANAEAHVVTGAIIQTFQSHNAAVRRQFVAQGTELREMIVLLTGLLRQACRGNQRTVSHLDEIKRQLTDASQVEDLRAVKAKLTGCLSALQTELDRQVVDSEVAHVALKAAEAKPAMKAVLADQGECPITGLPGRQLGVECLNAARLSDGPRYAAVLSLERFSTVSHRFGNEAAQSYVLTASQMVAQKLQPCDQLFRWSGAAFLAVLERTGSLEAVQAEINRIVRWRAEYTVTLGERSILVPASINSLCLPVWEAPNAEVLVERIDSFALKGNSVAAA